MSEAFSRWSARIALMSGYWQTFVLVTGTCVVWALSGPLYGLSDTWQLVINTETTVLTFLMVFLIQNTQNRDALAVHLKLDERIRAVDKTQNEIVAAEVQSDADLNDSELPRCMSSPRKGKSETGHRPGDGPQQGQMTAGPLVVAVHFCCRMCG